ncbi:MULTISPECIES: hypothetical protein [Streptomyces]|uniref:hypothetical protein n=1 Tax=Streptomyces TaxID=1883 RepID=UPI0004CD94B1|nr:MULTISPECIES: hypothetical protein [Streptomyces]KOT46992.1 hypothetical protein ADK43_40635 [Streptomyces rimosus subsp. rimosus]
MTETSVSPTRQLGAWQLRATVPRANPGVRPDVHLLRAGQRVRLEYTGDLLEQLLATLDGSDDDR